MNDLQRHDLFNILTLPLIVWLETLAVLEWVSYFIPVLFFLSHQLLDFCWIWKIPKCVPRYRPLILGHHLCGITISILFVVDESNRHHAVYFTPLMFMELNTWILLTRRYVLPSCTRFWDTLYWTTFFCTRGLIGGFCFVFSLYLCVLTPNDISKNITLCIMSVMTMFHIFLFRQKYRQTRFCRC